MDNGEFIELIKSGDTEAVGRAVLTGQVSLRALEQDMDEQSSYMPGTTPSRYARKFFLDNFTELMEPCLGRFLRDKKKRLCTEHRLIS